MAVPNVSHAVIVERPGLLTLCITGAERKSWLHGLLTANIEKVEPGRGAWALALTKQGKIVAELMVLEAASGALWVGAHEAQAGALQAYLDAYLIMEEAEVSEPEADISWCVALGEGATALAGSLEPEVLAWGSVPLHASGAAAWVVRRSHVVVTKEALEKQGLAPRLGAGAWEFSRFTYGLPLFGVDFSAEDNPHQAGLERRTVDWSKGCYLGQEVVCMQELRGKVRRRVVWLRIEGADAVQVGASVMGEQGQLAGEVTSVRQADGEVLAFARLAAPYFEGAIALQVGGRRATIRSA